MKKESKTTEQQCNKQNVSIAKRTVCSCKWNKQSKIFSSATLICRKCGGVIAN